MKMSTLPEGNTKAHARGLASGKPCHREERGEEGLPLGPLFWEKPTLIVRYIQLRKKGT